jgi:hypothetical protein
MRLEVAQDLRVDRQCALAPDVRVVGQVTGCRRRPARLDLVAHRLIERQKEEG